MRTAILLTTLVASALASPKPAIEVVEIREISDARVREIARRQTSSFDLGTSIPSACIPPTTLPAAPTIPADLQSALLSWSDPCHGPSLTGKLASEFSSYTSAASVWAKSVEPAMSSWESAFKTACPYATAAPVSYTALPSTYSFNPSGLSCGASGTKGGAATTSGAGSASGQGSTGAAPQQTAFAAAGVLAGVAGVLAAL